VDESAIFTESQVLENRRLNIKKSKLVKDTVNKGILLKKFKPVNFITGFQNKLKIESKVLYKSNLNQQNISRLEMAAFNKKSKEYKEIISNSKSPSKNITKSFGVKNQSSRVSRTRKETNGSPNQFASNYSKSSWKKNKKTPKMRMTSKSKGGEGKKDFEKVQVRPK
jgi:hypothetical protein